MLYWTITEHPAVCQSVTEIDDRIDIQSTMQRGVLVEFFECLPEVVGVCERIYLDAIPSLDLWKLSFDFLGSPFIKFHDGHSCPHLNRKQIPDNPAEIGRVGFEMGFVTHGSVA